MVVGENGGSLEFAVPVGEMQLSNPVQACVLKILCTLTYPAIGCVIDN